MELARPTRHHNSSDELSALRPQDLLELGVARPPHLAHPTGPDGVEDLEAAETVTLRQGHDESTASALTPSGIPNS